MLRYFLTLALAGSLPAMAGEFAILKSGIRLEAQRHEVVGDKVRLFNETGMIELPAAVVADFEYFADPQPQLAPVAETRVAPAPVAKPAADPVEMIREAALRAGLPPEFVASVARVESAFQTNAISSKGAIGVMQLMPATAKALGADPKDPRQNIEAGTQLLRDLLLRYDGDVVKALAAYNAGAGAVSRYGGLPPYDETRRYVNKVIGAYQKATGASD